MLDFPGFVYVHTGTVLRTALAQIVSHSIMKKIVLFALLLVSSLVFAHSGGTDKDGCHNDRKAGTRHCH
ncbi:YHYH domain-containing protein [Curvibacter sp. CHRR-16]|uniref:YHYH domain-containing protein n=1 Tax=Curvibacter sp. CHRR-16 TaxID=2835872 RepID=UPI0032E9F140